MSDSATEISLITPLQSGGQKGIEAYFTRKNSFLHTPEASVKGLNLGYNTADETEAVSRNRELLFSRLKMDPQWVAYGKQVHSNRVRTVTEGGTYPQTDGLVTRVPGLTLAIQVADCAAVLLWDEERKVVGALHAGWRGAVGDIVPIGINMMAEQGARPPEMKAFISPCISVENFEVGPEVADQFPEAFVDFTSYRKPHVDLKNFLKDQLSRQGIQEQNIEIRSECSVADEAFYSYRREGEQSGRMMALIRISE